MAYLKALELYQVREYEDAPPAGEGDAEKRGDESVRDLMAGLSEITAKRFRSRLASVPGGAAELIPPSGGNTKPGHANSFDAAVRAAVAAVGVKDMKIAKAWRERREGGYSFEWSPDDERWNVRRAAEIASAVNADLRYVASLAGGAMGSGRTSAYRRYQAEMFEIVRGPAFVRGAAADARFGRWAEVRAKMAYFKALELFMRQPTGGGMPPGGVPKEDVEARAALEAIDRGVDAAIRVLADTVVRQTGEVERELPASWADWKSPD